MANLDDEQFKSYLKSFRPVAPEPLPVERHLGRAGRLFALTVTAAVSLAAVVLVAVLLFRARHRLPAANEQVAMQPLESSNPSQIGTPILTKLALDDQEAFDEFMNEKVRTQFPPMNSEGSALRILAKE
jgi:negative regulator of sigma E activity